MKVKIVKCTFSNGRVKYKVKYKTFLPFWCTFSYDSCLAPEYFVKVELFSSEEEAWNAFKSKSGFFKDKEPVIIQEEDVIIKNIKL